MRVPALVTMLAAPLALAACDSGEEEMDMSDMPMATEDMPMEPGDMPMMQEDGEGGQTASAEGTVTAVDAEAGTITIDHGPVPAVDWPAMMMAFDADEALREQVAVGDEVNFEFRTGDEGSEVTSITKK